MSDLQDKLAFYLTMDDPESTGVIGNAYCVLVETHTNTETKTLAAVFKCWRSRDAYFHEKRPFNALNVTFTEDKGGRLFFEQRIHIGKQSFMEQVRDFCLEQHELLKSAQAADQVSQATEEQHEPA